MILRGYIPFFKFSYPLSCLRGGGRHNFSPFPTQREKNWPTPFLWTTLCITVAGIGQEGGGGMICPLTPPPPSRKQSFGSNTCSTDQPPGRKRYFTIQWTKGGSNFPAQYFPHQFHYHTLFFSHPTASFEVANDSTFFCQPRASPPFFFPCLSVAFYFN